MHGLRALAVAMLAAWAAGAALAGQTAAGPRAQSGPAAPDAASPAGAGRGAAESASPDSPAPGSTAAASGFAREDAAVRRLREDITRVTTLPGVARGSWGIVVQSLDRNERIVGLNEQRLLVPASIAKLVSAASAADAVGWNFQFETTLRATGPIEDGVLKGDLLVVGSGDPSIGGEGGDDLSAWVQALAASGIRRIDGRIVGDDDAVEEPRPALSWAWDDLGYATGGLFGALNYADNRLVVTVTPGDTAGTPMALSVEPRAGHRPLVNRTTTGAAGSPRLVWPEQRPGEAGLTIAGSLPLGAPPLRLAVSAGNPTAWFAGVLRYELVAAGIEVRGPAVDIDEADPRPDPMGATRLYTHRSRPLAAIVRPMLKDSLNLYAEALFRLNAPPGVLPTNDAAIEGLKVRFVRWGIPEEAQHQIDGSGLSRRTVVAPEMILRVLQVMDDPTGQSPFVTGLPVAGVDGSLQARMKGTRAQGNVRAKTGTMSTVRSLAGYVTTADRERLAFVVMLNNFEGTGAQATDAMDRIAVALASFSRR